MNKKGKRWAYSSFALGILTSMAGNVAHTMLNPHANMLAIFFSLFWPAAVFGSIETMANSRWPNFWWGLVVLVGLSLVAVVALVASYHHISALLASYGEDPTVVALGPLSPDGLMIVATVALLADRRAESPVEAPEDMPTAQESAPELAAVLEAPEMPAPALPPNGHASGNGKAPDDDAKRAAARAEYLASRERGVRDGKGHTQAELASIFGMSREWGRDRIREAQADS